MDRLRYRPIEGGWGPSRVVAGHEVQLPCGARGAGETLDDALRAAEHARDTHSARVRRMEIEAERRSERWRQEHPESDTEIPF